MSIAGGMPRAVERAVSVGAGALQLFVKSSNQWAARVFDPGEPEAFRRAARDAGLENDLVAHASYLINLASQDDALWTKSVTAFGVEIDRCAELGVGYLVVHPGSPKDAGPEAGIARVAAALDRVYGVRGPARRGRESVMTLIEITAGQGNLLGGRFEEIGAIVAASACEDRLGLCFDTCHAFAAGTSARRRRRLRRDLRRARRGGRARTAPGLPPQRLEGRLGSRLDRHEHIGKGQVGLEAFRRLMNDARFAGLPMVLETPEGGRSRRGPGQPRGPSRARGADEPRRLRLRPSRRPHRAGAARRGGTVRGCWSSIGPRRPSATGSSRTS